MTKNKHHLIFEGAELCGKSYLISQIYNSLEEKYNKSKYVLDGCHWFNCDVGIFGTENGKGVVESDTDMMDKIQESNRILEKYNISEKTCSRIFSAIELKYSPI